ncbi:hypothetical protein L6164_026349 [Bauhinia variegata]|uniref:Uncharacterized protein n=1 Tax=Bauhinia variegata TaxID=167791 RepID=A0ACB9LQ45_BAUVA|nr:hypothetical protein L6164_026349 [Bauhinia variegata]
MAKRKLYMLKAQKEVRTTHRSRTSPSVAVALGPSLSPASSGASHSAALLSFELVFLPRSLLDLYAQSYSMALYYL